MAAKNGLLHKRLGKGLIVVLCAYCFYWAFTFSFSKPRQLPVALAQKKIAALLNQSQNQDHQTFNYVNEFYRLGDYIPVWLNDYELSPASHELLNQLTEISVALNQDNFLQLQQINAIIKKGLLTPADALELELLIAESFFNYSHASYNNTLLPQLAEKDHRKKPSSANSPEEKKTYPLWLQELMHDGVMNALIKMRPTHRGYRALRKYFQQLSQVNDDDIWQSFTSDQVLRRGMLSTQVKRLRQRLHLTGDFDDDYYYRAKQLGEDFYSLDISLQFQPEHDNPYFFDHSLARALRKYQRRHDLPATGEFDQATLALFNIPKQQQLQIVALNILRLRQLTVPQDNPYVLVNMANFSLDLIDEGQSKLNMKVIIGKPYRRTPELTKAINTVVLNPYWNVPRRIAVNDILPKIKKDPNYLDNNEMEVLKGWDTPEQIIAADSLDWKKFNGANFPYRLRQKPGNENSLGRVKFLFPNAYSVYLHDTSHPELFAKDNRALSSGCIRLAKPHALAQALLLDKEDKRGQLWSQGEISQQLQSQQETFIYLQDPIPIYLTYWTVWVDASGEVQHRPDVYQRDKRLVEYSQQHKQIAALDSTKVTIN